MTDSVTRTRRTPENIALATLAVLSGILAGFLVITYLQYVLFGIVLAYVLWPAQQRLEAHVGAQSGALILITVAVFAILLPIAYVLTIAIQQGLALVDAIQEGALSPEAIRDHVETTGYDGDLDLLYATYQEPIESALQSLATSAITFVSGLPGVLIGLTVTIFVLFALLRDGDRLIGWLRTILPIEARIQRRLLGELDTLMWASVVGNVAVAAIQALMLGIGLLLLGLPGVVFLTVATFVVALLPLIGAFGIWVPVSIYLLAVGRPVAAAFLVGYGSIVSISDVYLRPVIIGRSGAINVAIIVVGIFGGIILFGAVGLFVGPVVLGGAKVVLDVFAEEVLDSTSG